MLPGHIASHPTVPKLLAQRQEYFDSWRTQNQSENAGLLWRAVTKALQSVQNAGAVAVVSGVFFLK